MSNPTSETIADQLQTLRGLSSERQFAYIAYLILQQNPRLRLGDNMPEAVSFMARGKLVTTPEYWVDTNPLSKPESGATNVVHAVMARLDVNAVLTGHPVVEAAYTGGGSYLHLYSVQIISVFGDYEAGDDVPVTFESVPLTMKLTQELIDANTSILVYFGLSS